jgi:glycosyltransferase involved in cell wall biosynthesis
VRIFQVVNTVMSGDAIGNNILFMYHILKKFDPDTKIYAINIANNLKQNYIKHLKDLSFIRPDDVIIYHLCECSEIHEWLNNVNCKKIAIYHNTTPPEFFRKYDLRTYFRQIKSVMEIQKLNKMFDCCIAVSEFNKSDLVEMGFAADKIIVMPLLLATYEYTEDIDNLKPYFEDDMVNILFVGRVVPHKKQEDIIRAFAYYKKFINKNSRLILIGSPFTNSYLDALKMYVNELGISDVVFKSGLSFTDIKRIYKSADLFLCMSEHEGFCVPLVEAMLFDIPIIAYKSTAVTETLGPGGCLVDTKNIHFIANCIDKILSDDELKNEILAYQRERVKNFEYDLVYARWEKLLGKLLSEV